MLGFNISSGFRNFRIQELVIPLCYSVTGMKMDSVTTYSRYDDLFQKLIILLSFLHSLFMLHSSVGQEAQENILWRQKILEIKISFEMIGIIREIQ